MMAVSHSDLVDGLFRRGPVAIITSLSLLMIIVFRVDNNYINPIDRQTRPKEREHKAGDLDTIIPMTFAEHAVSFTVDCSTTNSNIDRKACFHLQNNPEHVRQTTRKRQYGDKLDLSSLGIVSLKISRISLTALGIFRISLSGNCLFCYNHYGENLTKAFQQMDHIKSLDLRRNTRKGLFKYDGRLFTNLTKLSELYIDAPSQPTFRGEFQLLRSLELLSFKGGVCHMRRINNQAFVGFAQSPIRVLDLSECGIERIESRNVFDAFPNLQILRISDNKFLNLESVFFDSIRELSSLPAFGSLVADNVVRTNPRLVKCSDHKSTIRGRLLHLFLRLENLSLKHNCIGFLNGNELNGQNKNIGKLHTMDLSYNSINLMNIKNAMFFEKLPQIRMLNLNHQRYFDTGIQMTDDKFSSMNLTTFMSRKLLGDRPIPWNINPNLQELHLNGAVDAQILNVDFVLPEFNQLRLVEFTNNSVLNPQFCVYGLNRLDRLELSHNGLMSLPYCYQDILPSIRHVNLSNNNLGDFVAKQDYTPQQPKLELWDYSKNGLYRIAADIFHNTSMRTVYFSHNHFQSRNKDNRSVFDMLLFTPKLEYMDLSYNHFRYIDQMDIEIIESHPNDLLKVDLYGNPFSCDSCEAILFLLWYQTDLARVTPRLIRGLEYTCTDMDGREKHLRDVHVTPLRVRCFPRVAYTLLLFIVLSAVLVHIVLRLSGRTLVPFVLNSLHIFPQKQIQYKYDLYIVYDDKDLALVLRIREHLNSVNLRVCMRDIEFLPGDSFSDSVIDSIRQSRRTVLVISEPFIRDTSGWRTWETEMVHVEQVEQQRHLVLVILLSNSLNLETRPLLHRLVAVEPNLMLDVDQESCQKELLLGFMQESR